MAKEKEFLRKLHLRGGGGRVRTPCTLPLDPPLDNENFLHGRESLVDFTQLRTGDSAVLDEWQHLAGAMRETTRLIVSHPGSFHIHVLQKPL